jgi:hypothetical protein
MGEWHTSGRRDLKNPLVVYVTLQAGRHALYTEAEYLSDFAATVTVTSVYRWMRSNGHKRPIALHTDDQDGFTRNLDDLNPELLAGRLSVTLTTDLPPVPPNPDQEIIDLLTLLGSMPMEG